MQSEPLQPVLAVQVNQRTCCCLFCSAGHRGAGVMDLVLDNVEVTRFPMPVWENCEVDQRLEWILVSAIPEIVVDTEHLF